MTQKIDSCRLQALSHHVETRGVTRRDHEQVFYPGRLKRLAHLQQSAFLRLIGAAGYQNKAGFGVIVTTPRLALLSGIRRQNRIELDVTDHMRARGRCTNLDETRRILRALRRDHEPMTQGLAEKHNQSTIATDRAWRYRRACQNQRHLA